MNQQPIPCIAKKTKVRASLFGVNYDFYLESSLNEIIFEHIDSRKKSTLLTSHINLHALALMNQHTAMRDYINESAVTWIDGMPVTYLLKTLGYPVNQNWRLTFLDWQHSFFSYAESRKLKILLVGSTKENIKVTRDNLLERYPQLKIAHHHGYLTTKEDEIGLLKLENSFAPHILLVGMGMPLQESWILRNKDTLKANVVMPVGGYFDYIAGVTYTPPRWSGKVGMEWFFRFISDPTKLAYRYFVEPWPVIFRSLSLVLKSYRNK